MKTQRMTSLQDMMPVMEERLASGQSVRFSPQGTSMLPMLRQNVDSVVLSPVTGKLKPYDLPFYKREDGKYILHRIVEVGETYTCMGDNQFVKETGVRHDQVIAVVTSFYRGEKEHFTSEHGYQMYCRLWYHSRHIRHFWRRGRRWLRRHFRRIA